MNIYKYIKKLSSRISINNWFVISIFLILTFSLAVRIVNLNYNSAFQDEATSIIIGRIGVFQGDWWSYNAANWMSGHPVMNPILSGIAYISGGIIGSRLLSVILGVLTIELLIVFTVLIFWPVTPKNYLAGIIAGTIAATAPVSLFVSRMSTYDMKAFYFLFLSLTILVWTRTNNKNLGKWYFLSFVSLFLALFSKFIVIIYIPLFVIYSYLQVRKNKEKAFYWKRYFFIPLALFLSAYLIYMYLYIFTFAGLQGTKSKFAVTDIIQRIYKDMTYEIWLAAIGSIVMLLKKQWRLLTILFLAATWILATHIVTQRAVWTMDKHVFISSAFFAVIAGIGISEFIFMFKIRTFRILLIVVTVIGLVVYSKESYIKAQRYNSLWLNTYSTSEYFKKVVTPGDKILIESGTSVILQLYDENFPLNASTFDWFAYSNTSGEKAYAMAVRDGYFNWIELIRENKPKEYALKKLHKTVMGHMNDNYKLIYSNDSSLIYARVY